MMAVLPEYKNKGAGSALLLSGIKKADNWDAAVRFQSTAFYLWLVANVVYRPF